MPYLHVGLVSAALLNTPFRTAYRHRHALSSPHERRVHRGSPSCSLARSGHIRPYDTLSQVWDLRQAHGFICQGGGKEWNEENGCPRAATLVLVLHTGREPTSARDHCQTDWHSRLDDGNDDDDDKDTDSNTDNDSHPHVLPPVPMVSEAR